MNREITFITPCFCRSADCSESGMPEIRPASIRGQLRWWFRALYDDPQKENDLFGSIQKGGHASKVIVRVRSASALKIINSPTLPHKGVSGSAAPKKAIAPHETFELLISWRLQPSEVQKKEFNRALNAWLLMGALGLRATRGGGNFTYKGQVQTPEEYRAEIQKITEGSKIEAGLSSTSYKDSESARKIITDTLKNLPGDPLGTVQGNKRKTSPLRFRIAQLGNRFHIACIWDGRENITGNQVEDFWAAIEELIKKRKQIGNILDECFPAE